MTEEPNKLRKTKYIVKFVVAKSVNFAVATVVTTYVPAETKLQKAEVFIASYALSSMVSGKAAVWAGRKFDETLETVEMIRDHFKEEHTAE